MKFLYKISLLILVCTSNFIFNVSAKNDRLNELLGNAGVNNNVQTKDIDKAEKYIDQIFKSENCNCTKLRLLNSEQLDMASTLLFMIYFVTPGEKELQKEKLIKLFPALINENLLDEFFEKVLDNRNKTMKCIEKAATTINELKKEAE